ncbi:MAG: aspartyl protease family protein [Chloroflexota bacterium]|nr:aspartyl protease family protein [Chloroflexota bacterium]MDE2958565.1 aspartyl protease family protein [Chloroflexota bacterium]
MGAFSVSLWVGNLFSDIGADVEATVDTGATHSMIPASVLRGLGIEPVETRLSRIADGSRMELQTAWARFSAQGRNAVARVSFGPEGVFLMGATTLEDMGLAVDPVDQRLVEQEDLLM